MKDAFFRMVLVVFSFFFFYCSKAHASDAEWATQSGNWSIGSNWTPASAPGSTNSTMNTDTASFYSGIGSSITIDQPNQNIGSILFASDVLYSDSVGTLGGNSLLLSSGGSITDTQYSDIGADQAVYAPLILEPVNAISNGTYTFANNATGLGGLYFGGNISGGTTSGAISLNLTGTSNGNGSQIVGNISNGSASSLGIRLTTSGTQAWVLTGSNTYTGSTTLDAGILNVAALANGGNTSSIGASSNAAVNLIFGGGTLQYTGTIAQATDHLFTIGDAKGNTAILDASGTGLGTVSFTNAGNVAFANVSAHNLNLTGSNTGSNTFASVLTDQSVGNTTSLTKTGMGTWILTGTNIYTGVTIVSAGELDLNTTGGQSIGGSLTVNGGTTILLQPNQINGAANLVVSSGTFNIQGFNQNLANIQLMGGAIIGSGGALFSANAYDIEAGSVSATLSGSVGLLKSGPGTAILSGTNTYTGGTSINAGVLNLGSISALGGSSSIIFGGGTLQYSISNTQDYSSRIVNSTNAISIDTNQQNITYASTLADSNTGGLTKTGAGTLTLTGVNAYTGLTSISAGILNVGSSGALAGGGNITFNGGVLQYSASNMQDYSSRIVNSSKAISIDTNGQNVTYASGLAGSNGGGLTKTGTGILTLAGFSTYFGATNINAGTLSLGSNGALAGSGSITFGGGTLQCSASSVNDYSSKIINSAGSISIDTNGHDITYGAGLASSNTGGLTKLGTGTLQLNGSNSYTGFTAINAGILQLARTSSITNSTATINNGSTLTGTGRAGPLILAAGGIIHPGNLPAGTIGTLSASGLTWNSGGAMNINLGASGSSDRLSLSQSFQKGSSGFSPGYVFNFNAVLPAFAGYGTYNLVAFNSTTFSASDFSTSGYITGFFTLSGNTLQFTVTPTFTSWEASYFTAQQLANPMISGATAIPQNDSIPNLLKYFFNINPASPMSTTDRAALPIIGIDTTTTPGTSYLTLTYRQNALESGLRVNVQTSVDLKNWQTVIPDITQSLGSDPNTGDPIMKVEVNTQGTTKEFIRLSISSA